MAIMIVQEVENEVGDEGRPFHWHHMAGIFDLDQGCIRPTAESFSAAKRMGNG
jgi:hypothetical protein